MASTIKVDNVQNQPGTNIINKCGTTITLGASSDTVALASGASQTGFGRTGTVDWDTASIKTGTFSAVSGNGYFVNTSAAISTVNLPAGVAGAIVAVADYTRTFATYNLTVSPNGVEKIGGINADATLNVDGQSATFVYVDGTEGWINIQETQTSVSGINPYITASGGTVATVCTNYKTHTFTGPGTFCVTSAGTAAPGSGTGSNLVDYMVVAGGGGSGGSTRHIAGGGGGGAGGFKESPGTASGCYTVSPRGAAPAVSLSVPVQAYPITIGAGGTGGTKAGGSGVASPNVQATSGANSIFSSITSAGGGFGGQGTPPALAAGAGGSGGGGGGPNGNAGAGNTPPSNPVQGMVGGDGAAGGATLGGSGGGATGAGIASPSCGTTPSNPSRGTGATTNISASPVAYATGGRFNCYTSPASTPISAVGNATDNTGNGACAQNAANPGCYMPDPGTFNGVNGASGVVIIRYKFQN